MDARCYAYLCWRRDTRQHLVAESGNGVTYLADAELCDDHWRQLCRDGALPTGHSSLRLAEAGDRLPQLGPGQRATYLRRERDPRAASGVERLLADVSSVC